MIWSGCKVLVTGGAGAIGSQLCNRLVAVGARVSVIDDLSSGCLWRLPAGLLNIVQGSILDDDALAMVFSERPEVVFHMAALFANQNSLDHPEQDLDVNGLGTWRILDQAAKNGVSRLVYTSSSCVYGNTSALPSSEEHAPANAHTPYQATKFLGEQYAHVLQDRLPLVVARLFNSYGPGDLPGRYRSVVPNFIAAALEGAQIEVHGTGTDTRDFTYVDDIVDGLLRCAEAPQALGHTINLGSGTETSVVSLAQTIVRLTGSSSQVVFVPARKWDGVRRRCADIRRARELLEWRPSRSLKEGLTETIAWQRAHHELFAAA